MGIGIIIHGYIESLGFGSQKESKRVYRHNKAVINSIPDINDDWPFFTKRMFSVLPLRTSFNENIPQYDSLVISFGASYKNMYILEAEWINKFEALLKKLCWESAIVYNDFTNLKYVWEVEEESHKNFYNDPPLPPKKWKFSCFKYEETEIDSKDAIDGNK